MSIRLRNGRWVIDYYPRGSGGGRVQRMLPPGTTRELALAIEKEIRGRRGGPAGIAAGGTIEQFARRYLEHITLHLAPTTCRDIRNCFRNHVIPYFGAYRVTDLSTSMLSAYQQHRSQTIAAGRKKPTAPNRTINKELSYFSAFLSWIERESGESTNNPLRARPLPYRRPLPVILTGGEMGRIVKMAEKPYQGILMSIAHLALRITSARMLTWPDIDLPARTLKARLKGGREIMLPLPDQLAEWLLHAKKKDPPGPWAFPSVRRPDLPISDIRGALARARKRAGITKRVTPHLFRHSAAAWMLDSGVDIRTVQEVLGHTDIRMTQWYTQVMTRQKRAALEQAGYIKPTKRRVKK